MKKKIAITGANGRIGKLLVKRGAIPLECDVTNKEQVQRAIDSVKPGLIAHLAAKSEVDFCEANQPIALNVNFRGSVNVFEVAEKLGIGVAFISSDHIFDGKRGNYKEVDVTNHKGNCVNYYGILKLGVDVASVAFENVKIVRTSTLFNRDRQMIKQYLDPLLKGQAVNVPTFLSRSFMYVPHFVESFWMYLNEFDRMPATLNISGGPHPISWYEFVHDMADVYGVDTKLVQTRNEESEGWGAPRPKLGGLNTAKSESLKLPQFTYLKGLQSMKQDEMIKELGYE